MTARPTATARLRAPWLAIFAALLALLATPAFAQSFPKLTGLVVDAANVIPDDQEAALAARLEAFQQRTKRQLVVATIPDLEGRDIADYGYRLGRAWGVGLNEANNGTVLIVAPNERKVRIEVGYGLEPILTDALSSVIINQTIVPRFKAGDMPGGISAGADALMNQLGLPDDEARAKVAAAEAAFNKQHQRARDGGGGSLLPLAFWGFVLLFVFLSMARGRSRNRGWRNEGRFGGSALPIVLWSIAEELGRGGRGGGGGGFGGFGGGGGGGSDGSWGGGGFTGGGGGSFGGGGASGEW